ncbi:MAG: redoxin domain-containing protein, partial [Verrucomicrobiales bacterium]|nr:redoxin domain-containing protein [Verrucomicrobiales bacterium]
MHFRLFLSLFVAVGFASLAADLKPLQIGSTVPEVTLRSEDDREVKLGELVKTKPTVLIFYRGGWCPFCTKHLQALAGIQEEVRSAG